MNVSLRILAGSALALFVISYSFGRFAKRNAGSSSSEVLKSHEQTVDVATVVSTTSAAITVTQDHSQETIEKLDGTKVTIKHDIVTHEAVRVVNHEIVKIEYKDKVVEKIKIVKSPSVPASWRVGLGIGFSTSSSCIPLSNLYQPVPAIASQFPLVLGASIDRRIAGPVWLGLSLDSSKTAKITASLEF